MQPPESVARAALLPTPEQIELSSNSVDLGDFIDKLNDRKPHFRAIVAVEFRYGLSPSETRELSWRDGAGDQWLVAELDVVTTGNIPGWPEFGGLAHRLRGVTIVDEVPYAVGAMVADLADRFGLKVTSADAPEIPF